MKFKTYVLIVLVLFYLLLNGCCVVNRRCSSGVDYCKPQCGVVCRKEQGTFFNVCPSVKTPGYYLTDLNCLEKLKPLWALRSRGVGVIILGNRLRIIIPTDTFFDQENLDINECHVNTIAVIAEAIKVLPCTVIDITGHTDNVGTRRDKLRRSCEMAQRVAGHLWAQGIGWDRMTVTGRADCDQISSDGSIFGSSDNRRVEIRLDFSGNYRYNCLMNNNYCPDCVGH